MFYQQHPEVWQPDIFVRGEYLTNTQACGLAALSQLVYCPFQEVRDAAIANGWGSVESVHGKSVDAFLFHHRDTTMLVFRGTQQPLDWLLNFLAVFAPVPGGFGHYGFDRGAEFVWTKARHQLRPNLWIGGHSAGGSLTQMFCLYAIPNGLDPDGVVAIAPAPCLCFWLASKLSKHFDHRARRVENNCDVVTMMGWPVLFAKPWPLTYIDSGNEAHTGHLPRLSYIFDRINGGLLELTKNPVLGLFHGLLQGVTDHDIESYCWSLWRVIDGHSD